MAIKTECPVCRCSQLVPFLRRERVPVHQNLLMMDADSARNIERGDLDLVVCRDCGFIFNRAFDASKMRYGQHYDNSQLASPYFRNFLDGLIKHLVDEKYIRNRRILDVGCGDGLFLRKLVEDQAYGNIGLGFDPAYTGPDKSLEGRLTFRREYYGEDVANIPADVVVCRQVVTHVADPISLFVAIKKALIGSPHPYLFLEAASVEWVLSNNVVWDFFYEFCSYYSVESLTTAAEIAGFSVERVDPVFQGQYLWLEATVYRKKTNVTLHGDKMVKLALRFAEAHEKIMEDCRTRIRELAAEAGLAIWGAGAKGMNVSNLVDPDGTMITCLVDMNPNKQGRFVPGTGHPIVGYTDLPKLGVKKVLVMNPNYESEIRTLITTVGIEVEIVH